ncbi:hypothetical protein ACFFMP_12925 [Pseudoroseomonas cervicalis]|uniref:Uncharacterized protein n=1 Tax=Pseudoroseomonas cervicalis ATCC 49957 TaxID=525371 RepID=D5RK22_9PROT|nr:hypothetical protein [Pseudoroseomonas cervicalis]EFH12345.1 hypothetical protein HMPREF0731_1432 [Pseudoroseomonas cervicalis ATCC 49957]
MAADTPPPAELDLASLQRADALVAEAGLRARAEPILARLQPVLSRLDPAMQALGHALAQEIARLGVTTETLRQEVAAARRSREDWVRLDPLRYIPASRRAAAPPPPPRLVLMPRDDHFSGAGWHGAESDGSRDWRWSGRNGETCTLLLPSLGAGRLRLTLQLVMPFGARWNAERSTLVLNAQPVPLRLLTPPDSTQPLLQGEVTVEDDAGLGPLSLVLVAPRHTAPSGGDTRALGPGLVRLEIERLDAAA